MTNEQWESNRQEFSNKYQDQLPIKIKKTKEDKLKILLSCLSFKTFTGSEVYVYELAKGLVKMGHDVTVLSEIGGPLTDKAKKIGIKVKPFSEPPGFKMGDGKWLLKTNNGDIASTPNTLARMITWLRTNLSLKSPVCLYFLISRFTYLSRFRSSSNSD